MKFKLIATAAMVLGLVSAAHADTKVAEFGDPVLGNSWGGCTFTKTYSTGGGGYLFDQYQISCPTGTYSVGVAKNTSTSWPTCTFYPGNSTYYVQGDCSNWRVYLRP